MATQSIAIQSAGARHPPVYQATQALGSAVVFATLALLCIELSRGTGSIAAVWLPNAVAIAWLLQSDDHPNWPVLVGCLTGNLAAGLLAGDPLHLAIGLVVANIFEITIAVLLVRRFTLGAVSMADLRSLLLVVAAAIAAPMFSALVASAFLAMDQSLSFDTVVTWYLANGLGVLLVVPVCLIFADILKNTIRMPERSLGEWVAMIAFALVGTVGIFAQTRFPLLFLADLIIVACAFRLGLVGTAVAMIIVAAVASFSTFFGTGPISLVRGNDAEKLLVLQTFLAAAFTMSLPVSTILDRRQRDFEIQASERRELALLAANITDAILRFDSEGVCTYASPSTHAVLGTPPQDFVGIRVEDRAHPESRDSLIEARDALVSGAREKVRFIYRRLLDAEDGSPVYIEADCAVTRNAKSGAHQGIIVSARDVTERVALEHRLKRATRHAENAARAKAQFLANMSHEIRTPMNGVLGFADLLQQMDLSEEAAHHAALIVRSGRSMMTLLNDILDISKIESGQLVLSFEDFDPVELVEDCVRLHQVRAKQKGISLRFVRSRDIPSRAASDPLRVRQILLNLIANAVKFTDRGSVEVTLRMNGDAMTVTVEDTGIGIASKRIERIFDPFIQAESTTTRRFGGTGLGLSISRQLADMLGGSLDVASRSGVGSRFTLAIPLEAAGAGNQEGYETALGNTPCLPHRGRILLAEDHDINRMLVVAMLEQLQQDVTIAQDGAEAIAAVRAAAQAGAPFDLVLMDVQMPECDGYAATRHIRSAGFSPQDLPIVALTANAYAEDVSAALDAGMQDHLAKPLVYNDLAAILGRWLPVRVIDETALARPSEPASPAAPNAPHHTPEMLARWDERRSEAVQAVTQALAEDSFEGVRIEQLARVVHKLAGTAGMFGEAQLGDRAAALERALRANVERDVRRRLAEELLAAA